MKRTPPAELERALGAYRALFRRYEATLDLMSAAGAMALDRWIDEARRHASVIGGLSPAPARLLDVGSGAGLPGVVIAAELPELAVELTERRRRRVAFLQRVAAGPGLAGATVRHGDVAALEGPPVQVVTAGAVGPWAEMYRATGHRHDTWVTFVGRKGPNAADDIEALAAASGAPVERLHEEALEARGRLLAVRCRGGLACPSSR